MGDEEYLHKWWNTGELMEHATHAFGVLQSRQAIKDSIQKDITNTTLFSESKRFIICKKNNLEPIGEIGIIREVCFDSRVGKFSDVLYMDLLKMSG